MEHISVCICTHRRPEQLSKLLGSLASQDTEGRFEISVSIADNDPDRSAKPVAETFNKKNGIEVAYAHSPEKNLAHLRNLSLRNSRGDYVAFIDDDEYPSSRWLLNLHDAVRLFEADGALGPVLPQFQVPPPRWIIKGRLCERPRLPTGTALDWQQTRTGNALIKRNLVTDPANLFDLKYRLGAEDDAFFRKLMDKGYRFIWCDEAVVHESVPPDRLTLSYQLRRSRLIGYMSFEYYQDTRSGIGNVAVAMRSLLATLVLSVSLPLVSIFGFHRIVRHIVRIQYHRSVFFTAVGLLNIETRDL